MSEKYERLSGLDNSFLLLESRNAYMHIALTAVFEPGSLGAAPGGLDAERVRNLVASRLHLMPRYRQRLAYIPLLREPIWVDDDHFELEYHVRHTSIPRPGSDEQLRGLCARLLERHLDRLRPLWEIWLIEGLEGGRFAMLTKVHHCMVDGIGGVDLLTKLLGIEPDTVVRAPVPWSPRTVPSDASIVRAEVARRAGSALGLARSFRDTVTRPLETMAAAREQSRGVVRLARTGIAQTKNELFGRTIGPHRRIEWSSMPLGDVKDVKSKAGATINDVVLATTAGAVREFLSDRGVAVDRATLKAAVPVSIRAREGEPSGGNKVAAWVLSLPVGESDPLRRLMVVRQATADLKREHFADATHTLTEVAEWTGSNVLGLTLKLLSRSRPYDLIVTNVPGPPVPVYLLDAKMVAAYPHLPLFDGQPVGIALFSYAGTLFWGLGGDWDTVPDLSRLKDAVDDSFTELRDLLARMDEARHGIADLGAERRRRSGKGAGQRKSMGPLLPPKLVTP